MTIINVAGHGDLEKGEIINYKIPKGLARKLRKRYDKFNRKVGDKSLSPFQQLALVYEMMDYYNRLAVAPSAVCQPGCCHCCYLDVGVTPAEALYIADAKGIEYDKDDEKPAHVEHSPCPFLDILSSTCTVYEYRPIACRNFFTFDSPEYCWPPDQSHLVSGADNAFGNELMALLTLQVHRMSEPSFERDIRWWFPKVKER